LTRYPEIRIIIVAFLIVAYSATSSAASVPSHSHRAPASHPASLSYSVSMTVNNAPIGADPNASASVASAQELLTKPKFDDLHGTTTIVRPVRIISQFRTRREAVNLAPDVRLTPALHPGQRKLIHRGIPGLKVVTERVTTWDGVVVDRQTVHATLLRKAKAGHVLEGAPLTYEQLAASSRFKKLLGVFSMVATAYTPWTATAFPTGRTATGILAGYGIVAVDPRVIPLGSHVFVPGYGLAIAADTGGAIIGNRIDLCMESVRDAIVFGRRPVKVYLLEQ
jgi:3D (Asp-Asp-Asp) domain-containing protein